MEVWIHWKVKMFIGTVLMLVTLGNGLVDTQGFSNDIDVLEMESETRYGQLRCADPKFVVDECSGHTRTLDRKAKSSKCRSFKCNKKCNRCPSNSKNKQKCQDCCGKCIETTTRSTGDISTIVKISQQTKRSISDTNLNTAIKFNVHNGMGSDCYSKYSKINPYPAATGKSLSECQTICTNNPECGAILMLKASIESGGSTSCYMVKPNNLFNEGTCTWGSGTYNAYEKKITVLIYKVYKAMDSSCYSKYTKISPYPAASSKSLSECHTICSEEPNCGAIVMLKSSVESGGTTSCYMIKPNNLFKEGTCTWGNGNYNAYEKKATELTFKIHRSMGGGCYSKYSKIYPYPAAGGKKSLSECQTMCTIEPECGAVVMAKGSVEGGQTAYCYMVKPNNLFNEGTCTWGSGSYNAYEKEFTVCTADAITEAPCFCASGTSGAGEACAPQQKCNGDGTCQDGRTITFDVCAADAVNSAICFCEGPTSGSGEACISEQICNMDGTCNDVCITDALNAAACFCKGSTIGSGTACTPQQRCNTDGTCQDVCIANTVNSATCFCKGATSAAGEECTHEQKCNMDGTCQDVCAADAVNSDPCFCKSLTSGSGRACSAGLRCNRDGICYDVCAANGLNLAACFCEGPTSGSGEACTAGQRCNMDGICHYACNVDAVNLAACFCEGPTSGSGAPCTAGQKCNADGICRNECSATQHMNVSNTDVKTITSPGYLENKNYTHNLSCEWVFTAPSDKKVSFTMLEIDTEYGYDVIKIYDATEENDGKEPILATMSGNKSQQVVISNKQQMRIVFTSDFNTNMTGFKASVTAFKKTDLPKFKWIKLTTLYIQFPNGANETIQLNLISNVEKACIFQGKSYLTTVVITSPLSTSDKCQSLDQIVEISIISKNLKPNKAIYELKNGQLTQVDDTIFTDNAIATIGTKRNITNLKIPKLIQIPIKFGYDRGLYDKFEDYGQGKLYIEKRIEEIFYHSKWSLQGLLKETNIELLLDKNIFFVNEVLEIKNSHLLSCRKYQLDEEVPIVILVEEDPHNNKKGVSFRSGACRKNNKRYGVALISWRDDGNQAGEVLAHELGHLIGGIHIERNETINHEHDIHDNETLVGYSDFNYESIKLWFNSSGSRCYGKNCFTPPIPPHGKWKCDAEYHRCDLICDKGFSYVYSTIQCENGHWSDSINLASCSPSVLLMAGGDPSGKDVEIYNEKNVPCSNKPPALDLIWEDHTSFYHQGTVYLCGGRIETSTKCISFNGKLNTWRSHTLLSARYELSSVVMRNKLYLIASEIAVESFAISTTLPLTDTPVWVPVPNLTSKERYYALYSCVAKIDEENFVITGGYDGPTISNATKYNIVSETTTPLAFMNHERNRLGCIAVEESGKTWIVVSGGYGGNSGAYLLTSVEKLDTSIEGGQWQNLLGGLNVARAKHEMAVTQKGLIAVGGWNYWVTNSYNEYLKSVELLNWETEKWTVIDPITNSRNGFGGILDIPAHLFNCNVNVEAVPCPSGWTSLTTGCYRFFKERVTFDEAKTVCQNEGGFLAEVTTQNEQNDLSNFYKNSGMTTSVWLGASDIVKEGEWIWLNSGEKVTFSLWSNGEPNDYGGNEDCMDCNWENQIGHWNDLPCSDNRYTRQFLCEYTVPAVEDSTHKPVCLGLPFKQNGKWICDITNTSCFLTCDPGFVSLYTDTTCTHGIWKDVNEMECLESVLLAAGGGWGEVSKDVEIFSINSDTGNVTCSYKPPALDLQWWSHTSFFHQGTVYMCGGSFTESTCISIDSKRNTWRTHNLVLKRSRSSSVIMRNRLYFIGGYSSSHQAGGGERRKPISTALPLTDTPDWIQVPNLTYNGGLGQCVAKIDQDNFVIIGPMYWIRNGTIFEYFNDVIKYNVVAETEEAFPSMINPRSYHSCVVTKESNKTWIVVTGRYGCGKYKNITCGDGEKLDITGTNKTWETIGRLNVDRTNHGMAVTSKGLIVIGGVNGSLVLNSVELLDWESGTWELIKQSLTNARRNYGGVVEIPGRLFGCQIQNITITDCLGEYEYNLAYEGGNITQVPEGQSCHSVCQNMTECLGWTWTMGKNCSIILTNTSLETLQEQSGAISGLKNSCKPKCYLVLGDEEQGEISKSTQFCEMDNSKTDCVNMIHLEPDEYHDGDNIFVCYKVGERSQCEPIGFEYVELICNPEPGIITLSTIQHINSHFYVTHQRPYYGYGLR